MRSSLNSVITFLKMASCTRKSMRLARAHYPLVLLLLFGCNQSQNSSANSAEITPPKAELSDKTESKPVEDGASLQADLPTSYALGNTARPEVIAGWDIDVRPDGLGLPEGSGSVEDGEELYEDKCAMCHGSFGEGEDQWPKLIGGTDSLTEARPKKTIGSFWPYASTLFDYINRAMPFPAPQSLEPDEVYAITAYVLNLNEIVDEDFVLTKENFTTIEMPNKDGFYVDDRPDTNNTRCMKNCKDATQIKITLGPKYSLNKQIDDLKAGSTIALEVNKDGKATYESACKVCHGSGVANAPKFGDADDWIERRKQSTETIYAHAINGLNGMPAKGNRADLSDNVIKRTVDYMLDSLN